MMNYPDQRRAYRRQRRVNFGRLNSIIWPLAIVLFFITHTWIWLLLAVFAPMIITGLLGAFETNSFQQQQNQPVYQQPYQQQQEQPMYQPYTQGYSPQQAATPQPEIYQASEQPYQQQQHQQQQYEDPLTMYPQG
jgi:hypothetical protein